MPHPPTSPDEPCPHLTDWVNGLADDSLRGFPRWFTRLHLTHCRRCQDALRALLQLRERLRTYAQRRAGDAPTVLEPERWQVIESSLDAIDRREADPSKPDAR